MKRLSAVRSLFVYFLYGITLDTTHAQENELFGNTLVCTYSQYGHQSTLTIYVTKARAFEYHGAGPSKRGIIYEFGKTRSGVAGVNPYQSSAQIRPGHAELSVTLENRTCGICDGKTIMIASTTRLTKTGATWIATRNYRQWFPDGTRAAVPSGSEQYTCRLRHGRFGVGG